MAWTEGYPVEFVFTLLEPIDLAQNQIPSLSPLWPHTSPSSSLPCKMERSGPFCLAMASSKYDGESCSRKP